MSSEESGWCECCPRASCCPSAAECKKQCYGRLSPQQQIYFIVCVILAIIGNIAFLAYALAKVQYAYDHPVTSISEERWNSFPSWEVIFSPLYADDTDAATILGSSDSGGASDGGSRQCQFVNASCTVYRHYPLANGGGAGLTNIWSDSGIDCSSIIQHGDMRVPSSAWIGVQSDVPVDPALGVFDVTLAVSIVVNKSHVDAGYCSRLHAMVFGSGVTTDDSDMRVSLLEPGVGLIIGNGAQIAIRAMAHQHLSQSHRFYEVLAISALDTGRLSAARSGPDAPYTVRAIFSTTQTMTAEYIQISTETVGYAYDDAFAAIVAVVNATATALGLFFPLTPLVMTARLCLCDKNKYTTDTGTGHNSTTTGSAGEPIKLAATGNSDTTPSAALLSAEVGPSNGQPRYT